MSPIQARVLQLQRLAGNAAVTSLLQSSRDTPGEVTAEAYFEASIPRLQPSRRAEPALTGTGRGRPGSDRDAEDEGVDTAPDPAAVTGAIEGTLSPCPEAADGETVTLPDITTPPSMMGVDHDKVSASVDFNSSVAQSGAVSPFGATSWATFNVTGTTVAAKKGTYKVSFKVANPITYNVSSPKTSIASDTDPALTATNYTKASSDLTPRMDVQNGKPLRSQFWAKDLTLRHEKFHAKERGRLNKAGAKDAGKWLGTQTAASVTDVQNLVAKVPAKIEASSQAAVGTLDEKESRAYGDGASSYKSRAKAIKKRGDKGKYA